ncbi:MAG: hypothetical protein KJ600_04610 [Nanoarchaeota archaeon]|nr:hypothetical protein [Nanoarchaeota archaeon]MBU1103810.1 hypothetical protein [Nanoarchaeota archaeon]
MKKENIVVVAQLLTAIKDNIEKIEEAEREKDAEKLSSGRQEILSFQKKIGELLK